MNTPIAPDELRDQFDRIAPRSAQRGFQIDWDSRRQYLDDRTATTAFDRHYLYHVAWATRRLALHRPAHHVDVASILHFPSMLSAFIPTTYLEYRPVDLGLPGLTTIAADLNHLPLAEGSVQSLSCLHVIEHVGLGRYGDAIDPDGDLRAMSELARVLAPAGRLLLAVPVGAPRIEFNAHRIYSFDQIRNALPGLDLDHFALIPDRADGAGLILDADPATVARQRYACGCFEFRRPS